MIAPTPQKGPRTLLFDLDGTLTDPFEGIIGCIHYALEALGREKPAPEALRWFIGPPIHKSFGKLLQTDDPAIAAEGVRLYRERYGVLGLFENRPYDGISELLAALKPRYRLYVATSKAHVYARPILEKFNLGPYFDGIYGSELDGAFSDKGELIAKILAKETLAPETTLMIGDREHDVIGARKNGIETLGVLWGYGSVEELEAAGAKLFCSSPGDLKSKLISDSP